ncbi:MAG: glycosyltransferase family 2 protein [Planctomycetota bacterium]
MTAGHALEHANWQVPAFDALELTERRSDVCVCIPVIDEGERLHRQLERMREHADGLDIVIADGGSRDGSVDAERLATKGVRARLVKTGPGKLSAQMRMAMAWALEAGYTGLIFVDGNDKDDPEALPRFRAKLDEGFDHVQGSRYVEGGEAINTPWARHWGVKLLHAPLISLAARFPYTDTTNGFRAYSARFLTDPRVAPFRDVFQAYELHYYLAIRAARLDFRVCEIPTVRAYPNGGAMPTKISGVRGNLHVLRTLLRAALLRFDPPTRG